MENNAILEYSLEFLLAMASLDPLQANNTFLRTYKHHDRPMCAAAAKTSNSCFETDLWIATIKANSNRTAIKSTLAESLKARPHREQSLPFRIVRSTRNIPRNRRHSKSERTAHVLLVVLYGKQTTTQYWVFYDVHNSFFLFSQPP